MSKIETPEEELRKFMINAITKVDETITKIDDKYPYLKDKQPEEMLKDFMKEDIKEIKKLNATVRQFSNANANQPEEAPFKDALTKTIKTIWDKK